MNILFLDVDGPLIPARMYYNGIPRNSHGVYLYDPVAVSMIKKLVDFYKLKLVYNSSHNDGGLDLMMRQAITNGFTKEMLHDDLITKFPLGILNRMDGISEWLTRHAEVDKWAVVDDYALPVNNAVKIDFNVGITLVNFEALANKFGTDYRLM
jgi:hypothetical protein